MYVDDTSNCFHLLFLSLSPDCLETVHLYKKTDSIFSDGLVRTYEKWFSDVVPHPLAHVIAWFTLIALSWCWQRKSKIQFRRQWVAPECNGNFSEGIASGRLFPTSHRPVRIKSFPYFQDSNIEIEKAMPDTYTYHFSGKTQIKTVEQGRC